MNKKIKKAAAIGSSALLKYEHDSICIRPF